jgi:short-subunit dehydrogenase
MDDQTEKLNSEKVAVVTGASRGIGFEFAKLFAEHGYNLIITSDSDDIFEARDQLIDFGVDVEAIRSDLSRTTEVEKFYEVVSNSDYLVECVVLNAGVGLSGRFVENDLQSELKLIQLNCVSIVHLSKLIIPEMINNKTGKILFTSSLAAEMPGPFLAVYAASKAFVQSFAEAIRYELKDTGVTVTAMQPGPTDTNFFHRADMLDTHANRQNKDDPADVAKDGFEAMMKGKDSIVPGSLKNKLKAAVAKILPEETQAKMHTTDTKPDELSEH